MRYAKLPYDTSTLAGEHCRHHCQHQDRMHESRRVYNVPGIHAGFKSSMCWQRRWVADEVRLGSESCWSAQMGTGNFLCVACCIGLCNCCVFVCYRTQTLCWCTTWTFPTRTTTSWSWRQASPFGLTKKNGPRRNWLVSSSPCVSSLSQHHTCTHMLTTHTHLSVISGNHFQLCTPVEL